MNTPDPKPASPRTAAPGIVSTGWLADTTVYGEEGWNLKRLTGASSISFVLHVLAVVAFILLMNWKSMAEETPPPVKEKIDMVYLERPGPGGGGGGSPKPAPPKPMELPKPKPVEAVPVPVVTPIVEPPPPPPSLTAPVTNLADLLQAKGNDANSLARTGGGGRGTGDGPGNGPGLGPGSGGGTGGGPHRPGSGVINPTLIKEQKPAYTPDAIRAKLQGTCELEITILKNGTVDPNTIVVIRSLDRQFGLDEEAKKAIKQWIFKPGRLVATGEAIDVRVSVEMAFTLR